MARRLALCSSRSSSDWFAAIAAAAVARSLPVVVFHSTRNASSPPQNPGKKTETKQATPLVAGLGVAAAALTARQLLSAYVRYAASPASRGFYRGGFQQEMTRREALLILGLRESAAQEAQRVRDAHRRIMLANHPDSGGSPYISLKVNEARDLLLGKKRSGGSVF
jgi:DnaJ homolog subfamily C member 19